MATVTRQFPEAGGTVTLEACRLSPGGATAERVSTVGPLAVSGARLSTTVNRPSPAEPGDPWFIRVTEAGFGAGTVTYVVRVVPSQDPVRLEACPRTSIEVIGAPPNTGPDRLTVLEWERTRSEPYFIAHRGSGDVLPENSARAFEHAIESGAQVLEVSVVRTADDVLVINHDADFERVSSSVTGDVSSLPSTVLPHVSIDQMTQTGANAYPPMLFSDFLRKYGGMVVICAEAKDDSAYPLMIDMIDDFGLRDTVIIKAYRSSSRIVEAKRAGFKVFAYFGSASEITQGNLDIMVDQEVDYIVIPYFDGDVLTPMPNAEVQLCVDTGIPVWMYPLHRRRDVTFNVGRGVVGFACSGYQYVSGSRPRTDVDQWWTNGIQPGELTLDQSANTRAPGFDAGVLQLDGQGFQPFLSLGSVPNPSGSYTISFDARWTTLPASSSSNLTLVLGRTSDDYYQHQLNHTLDGYHAIFRPDGRLQLYTHQIGSTSGTQIGSPADYNAGSATEGTWMSFMITVTSTSLTWERTDNTSDPVTASDSTRRGAYIHIGRSANDGVLEVRNLVIGTP